MFKMVKSAAKTFNKERRRLMNCVECRIFNRVRLIERLTETVILRVYKASPHQKLAKSCDLLMESGDIVVTSSMIEPDLYL